MKVFGLTGGIASGKSTVSYMFEERGAYIIDADAISRQVVEPDTFAYKEILKVFGEEVALAGGGLDRRKLRTIVFSDAYKRNKLNQIVHPEVMKVTQEKIKAAEKNKEKVVIYEAALLVEIGLQNAFDGLIVVHCTKYKQMQRLIERDKISKQEAEKALSSQADTEEKLKMADFVIDTNGSYEDTEKEVVSVLKSLIKEQD